MPSHALLPNPAEFARLLFVIAFAAGCGTLPADERSRSVPETERAAPAPAAATAGGASEPAEPGLLPSAPLPPGAAVHLPRIQVEVTDFQRGDAAQRLLRAASPTNRAPTRSEYLLVRLDVTGVAPAKSWVGCRNFRVIGENRVAYFHASQVPPAPALNDSLLEAGQRIDGWCVYRIRANERRLILMVSASDVRFPRERRYLALEPGAALPRATIAAPSSEPAGGSPLLAAAPGQEASTQDWSVTALEIRRGAAAQRLVETANPRNPAPAEALEFVAVKLHARYRGRTEHPGLLSAAAFRTIDGDGRPYENPIVLDVTPRLTRMLLPGGEHTGWAVFQAAPGDTRAVLRFQPPYPDRERCYFALVEIARPGGASSE